MKSHQSSDLATILFGMIAAWTISISTALANNVASIPASLTAAEMPEMASSMDVTLGKSTLLRLCPHRLRAYRSAIRVWLTLP